jgi:hypothetical protein
MCYFRIVVGLRGGSDGRDRMASRRRDDHTGGGGDCRGGFRLRGQLPSCNACSFSAFCSVRRQLPSRQTVPAASCRSQMPASCRTDRSGHMIRRSTESWGRTGVFRTCRRRPRHIRLDASRSDRRGSLIRLLPLKLHHTEPRSRPASPAAAVTTRTARRSPRCSQTAGHRRR